MKWLVALALLCVGAPSLAQFTGNAAPPVRSAIDENGVDVITGSYSANEELASIGPKGGNGVKFSMSNFGGGWINGVSSQITIDGSAYVVNVDGVVDRFTGSGNVFTDSEGNGATLTVSNGTWTYTRRDGTVATFIDNPTPQGGVYPGLPQARGTAVVYPNGLRVANAYKFSLVCIGSGPPTACNGTVYSAYRLQTVNINTGYQIKFFYTDNILNGGNYFTWSNPATVRLLNNGIEACSVGTDACTLTNNWPSITLTYLTTGPNTYQWTATDSLSRAARYTVTTGKLSGIKRYGSASDNISVTYVNSMVSSLTVEGVTHSYSYSDSGTTRTTTVTDPNGGHKIYVGDTTTKRIASTTDELSRTIAYQYDSSARLTLITWPEGNKTQYTYDARGNVTEARLISKTPGTPPDIVTTSGFDATCTNPKTCNRPNWKRDANGNQTDYVYDTTHGGLLTATAPAPTTGTTRPQTRTSYTALQAYYKTSPTGSVVASGSPIYLPTQGSACQTGAICAGTSDEVKNTVDYGPQTAGTVNNLLPASVGKGAGDGSLTTSTTYTYDMFGNATYVDGPLPGTADMTRVLYDIVRRPIGSIGPDPDGEGALPNRAQRVTYNADDQVTTVEAGTTVGQSDAAWSNFMPFQQVTTAYDANARKTIDTIQSGSTTYALTQYSYDPLGRLDCSTIRLNDAAFGSLPSSACTLGTPGNYGADRIGKTVYDAASQVAKVQIAYGTADQADETTTTYSNNGKIATVTDGNGNLTTYEYDGFDRLAKTRYPSPTIPGASSTTDYDGPIYDANSNVTQRRLRDGQTIGYSYDKLNRLIAKDRPNILYWETDKTYAYDNLGRMTLASDSTNHQLGFAYDALGRQTSVSDNWYSFGNMSFQYDLAGRRTRTTWYDSFYVDYDRLVTGEVSAVRENGAASGIGVLASYTYDSLGHVLTLTRGNGAATTWSYDAISRLASLVHDVAGTSYDVTTTFGYNPASQIASNTRSNDAYAWTGQYNVDRSYAINGLNQMTAAGSTVLGYDGRGNLNSSGSKNYGYTSENELATATGITGLAYDALGRLFNINAESAVNTTFNYDGTAITAETDQSTGALLRRYVWGPGTDDPLVWYEGTGTTSRRWLIPDERGSVAAVTDASGAVTNVNSYDEYGIPAAGNAGRFGYTGQAWLPALGMWYYKARIYSATLGRFMQSDPLGYAGGINLYAYVNGDPVNLSDPLGLQDDTIVVTLRRSTSGTAGFGSPGRTVNTAKGRNPPNANVGGPLDGIVGCGGCIGTNAPSARLRASLIYYGGYYRDGQWIKVDTFKLVLGLTRVEAILYGSAGLGIGEIALASRLAVVTEGSEVATTTVGRYMSQTELDAMTATGRVQESFNGGVTSVTVPSNPGAYRAAPTSDIFTQFDVPTSSLRSVGTGTGKIYGPNSIFGPRLGITEMPPATNIVIP